MKDILSLDSKMRLSRKQHADMSQTRSVYTTLFIHLLIPIFINTNIKTHN